VPKIQFLHVPFEIHKDIVLVEDAIPRYYMPGEENREKPLGGSGPMLRIRVARDWRSVVSNKAKNR
jgi:hypothetical protein